MPLGARDVRDVQFSERTRGYNPHGVDDFLEQVAVRLDQLEVQLETAQAEATEAQRRLKEADRDPEVLARTLLLAQRTADQAIAEARERAAEILADAQQQAKFVVEEAHGDLINVAANLERQRDELSSQVTTLTSTIEQQRAKAVEVHRAALRHLETLPNKAGLDSGAGADDEFADVNFVDGDFAGGESAIGERTGVETAETETTKISTNAESEAPGSGGVTVAATGAPKSSNRRPGPKFDDLAGTSEVPAVNSTGESNDDPDLDQADEPTRAIWLR